MRKLSICSGTVNRYKFRILPAGIILTPYLKNPVLMVEHDGAIVSIGKMKDIHLNAEGHLVGTPEFDKKDPIAKLYKHKYKHGYVNACSLGGEVLETSNAPELMLEGQTKPTVTKLELVEISMCNIPADRDAVGDSIQLSFNAQSSISKTKENQNMDIKKIALKLGLSETATEADVLKAIETIQLSLSNAESRNIDSLIALGRTNGVITDKNVESFTNMAKLSYTDAVAFIGEVKAAEDSKDEKDAKKPVVLSVESLLKAVKGGGKPAGENPETFLELSKTKAGEVKLQELKANKPEYYAKLAKAYDTPVPEEV